MDIPADVGKFGKSSHEKVKQYKKEECGDKRCKSWALAGVDKDRHKVCLDVDRKC